MPLLELDEIATATGGDLIAGGKRVHISGFRIDSREVEEGDLFFCIIGPNNDGHTFLRDVASRGASAAIVSRDVDEELKQKIRIIKVADTTEALQRLARHVRMKRQFRVVGITGSTGKTTTKEMSYEALSPSFKTGRSRGNLNNLYGLPLSLLETDDETEVSILEMGMSYPGELRKLASISSPDIGVLTGIKAVHLEHFGSIDEIANAKAELFESMSADATALYNIDDERARDIGRRFSGRKFSFGLERNADAYAFGLKDSIRKGISFGCSCQGESLRLNLSLFGIHNVYNALAALSVCAVLGANLKKAADALARFKPFDKRGVILFLKRGITVIDDTYNSNPAAMEMVLRSMKNEKTSGRKAVVSGDMLELGSDASILHEKLGEKIADAGIDLLIAVGELSARTADVAARFGVRECRLFSSSQEAADEIVNMIRADDLILVKGSRGMKMEIVAEKLRNEIGEEC